MPYVIYISLPLLSVSSLGLRVPGPIGHGFFSLALAAIFRLCRISRCWHSGSVDGGMERRGESEGRRTFQPNPRFLPSRSQKTCKGCQFTSPAVRTSSSESFFLHPILGLSTTRPCDRMDIRDKRPTDPPDSTVTPLRIGIYSYLLAPKRGRQNSVQNNPLNERETVIIPEECNNRIAAATQ